MRWLFVYAAPAGVVVGGAWMMAVRPGHSKGAATLLVFSLIFCGMWLFVRGVTSLSRRRHDRIRRINETAAAALARDGFTVVDSILGDRYQDLIAIDDQQRVALCDLGPDGTPLRTQIVAADQVQASRVLNDHGGTSLVVTAAGQRREVVFAARRPTQDSGPDEAEQARITAAVQWWCQRLSGRQPTEPYQVSLSLGSRAHGQAFDAAVDREIVTRGLQPELPGARIMRR